MNLGRFGTLPLRLGGAPSTSERAYNVIRKAVGKGGSAENDTGIEGLWRSSKAKGLASATSHVRRAFIQSNPLFATDLIPYYERILGIVPPEGASEADRRAAIVPLWKRRLDLSMPGVEAALVAIDPRFSLVFTTHDKAITTQPGKAFSLPLPQGISRLANYSSEFVVRVLFDQGYDGPPNHFDLLIIERANIVVRELVQSWETWTISTGPWRLGRTPIGRGSI